MDIGQLFLLQVSGCLWPEKSLVLEKQVFKTCSLLCLWKLPVDGAGDLKVASEDASTALIVLAKRIPILFLTRLSLGSRSNLIY